MDPAKLPAILSLLEDAPDDPVLLLNAGKISFELGRLVEATAYLERLAEKHPSHMAVYRELGKLYRKEGMMLRSRRAYEKGRQVSMASGDKVATKEYEDLLLKMDSDAIF